MRWNLNRSAALGETPHHSPTGWDRCLCFARRLWPPRYERTGSHELPRPRVLLCWPALWNPCTRRDSSNMEPMVPRLKRPTCHLDPSLRIEPHSPTWCPAHEWHPLTLGSTPACVMVAGQQTGHPHPRNRSESNVQSLKPHCVDVRGPLCLLQNACADRGWTPPRSSHLGAHIGNSSRMPRSMLHERHHSARSPHCVRHH